MKGVRGKGEKKGGGGGGELFCGESSYSVETTVSAAEFEDHMRAYKKHSTDQVLRFSH